MSAAKVPDEATTWKWICRFKLERRTVWLDRGRMKSGGSVSVEWSNRLLLHVFRHVEWDEKYE